jgi:cell division protein FtsL
MSIDVEYAIKKDIRNNPVIREVDLRQKREFASVVLLAAVAVAMLLFSAWQHFEVRSTSREIEQLRARVLDAEEYNRKLQLQSDSQHRPQDVEQRAMHDLKMVSPAGRDVIVIQRTRGASPSHTIVADARQSR